MAEDISNYTFDFQKEVDVLRQEFGARDEGIAYFRAEVVRHGMLHKKVRVYFHDEIGGAPEASAYFRESITEDYIAEPNKSSIYVPMDDVYDPSARAVVLKEKDPLVTRFGKKNEEMMKLFVLYHETGHALIRCAAAEEDYPYGECAADAYAALRLLQRFGPAAEPLLSMISWSRAYDAINGSTDHLTTSVLDKIVSDSAVRDFSKLSSDDTIDLADKYAEDWTPGAPSLISARHAFAAVNTDGWVNHRLLAETCLSDPAYSLTFYITAKYLQPLLQRKGIALDGGKIKLSRRKRKKYAAAIAEQAGETRLCDVFQLAISRDAEGPSINDTLKVTRPAGQRKFIIKIK